MLRFSVFVFFLAYSLFGFAGDKVYYVQTEDGRKAIIDYTNPFFYNRRPTPFYRACARLVTDGLMMLPRFSPSSALANAAQKGVIEMETDHRNRQIALLEAIIFIQWMNEFPDLPAIHTIKIGGQDPTDTWNSLLLMKELSGQAFQTAAKSRTWFDFQALDDNLDHVRFGRNAWDVLTEPGKSLDTIFARFVGKPYDWKKPKDLFRELGYMRFNIDGRVLIVAQGSVFEYGTDEQVIQNLEAIADIVPADSLIIGDVYRDPESIHPAISKTPSTKGVPWQLRGTDSLRKLLKQTRWELIPNATEGPVGPGPNSVFEIFLLRRAGVRIEE